MKLRHTLANVTGEPQAWGLHPNGDLLVRLHDRWYFRRDCEEAA